MEQQDIDEKLNHLYKSSRKSGMLYTLIPLAIILTILMVFWSRLEERDKELNAKSKALSEKEKILLEKEKRINELDAYAGKQDSVILQINTEISSTPTNNTIDTGTIYYQRIEQISIADTSIVKIKENKSIDKAVKVEYYKQSSDGKKVIHALNEIGVKYDTLTSKIKYNHGPVNSIKYGSRVSRSTVNLLSLQLIKEGFELRSLEPLKESKGKENIIVIYRNSNVLSNPVIKAESLIK